MNGLLSEHPLAELIREAGGARLTGALRVERERVKVVAYFEAGEIVFATSNLRAHRLGEVLKRNSRLKDEEIANLEQSKAWNNDNALATALVNEGLLWQSGMEKLRAQQVSDVLRTALLWTDGQWKYEPRVRLAEQVNTKVDFRPLLLECARRLPRSFVISRFPVPTEMFSRSDAPENGFGLLPAEAFLLSRIEMPMLRSELTALSGLRDAEALRVAYGLALAGLLERSKWPRALEQKIVATPDAAKVEDDAEIIRKREERELENMLSRVNHADDHYEALDVPRGASIDEIKRAYHKLARLYHPDKYHMRASRELHARVEAAFARFAQAYETLGDLTLRSVYDAKLTAEELARRATQNARRSSSIQNGAATESQGKATKPQSPEKARAEVRFQQGLAAVEQGQDMAAIRCFAEAAQLVPGEARYRAHYGSALSAQPQGRRLAESELQAAIAMDPNNAEYHVMLARLCLDLRFDRRAQTELEKALALEPNNEAAQKLMKTLR
jgi:curved DNA-binding protein CbpA